MCLIAGLVEFFFVRRVIDWLTAADQHSLSAAAIFHYYLRPFRH
jgi:hypothetical protein